MTTRNWLRYWPLLVATGLLRGTLQKEALMTLVEPGVHVALGS